MRPNRWSAGHLVLRGCLVLAGAALARWGAVAAPPAPEWKAMDYGVFLSATLEIAPGNIANKAIAIRLDPGEGGVAKGREFFLFETDTLRAAAWSGPEFIDWKNIAFDGAHEVHASIRGNVVFSNPDAPGWADAAGRFDEKRVRGRDGQRYGPLPRDWGRWRGLYVHGNQVVLSYQVGDVPVLESPALEQGSDGRAVSRTFNLGPRARPLWLQVAEGRFQAASGGRVMVERSDDPALAIVCAGNAEVRWDTSQPDQLRLEIPPGPDSLRLTLLYVRASDPGRAAEEMAGSISPSADLSRLTRGGPRRWAETVTTRVERMVDARHPYQVESISVPLDNPYRAWMRLGGFDFFRDARRAAVCTWQGDVWVVDGLGGVFDTFIWRRIASGLFQPLGLKIIDDTVYVTCRDQITLLRDLNGDGETDFYQSFNNDAQVTEHFHEFAMDLQTDEAGNFYYAKGARHAKEALIPQHGTLLRVSQDGSRTEIVASGFRAPNGVCVNPDGTFMVSDQEGHWTPENRINWVKPGGFYGYMSGYHEGRDPDEFEPPLVWVHKFLDRSPAQPLWVASSSWGPLRGALISLSYGTGKILLVLPEKIGDVMQGGVVTLPIPAMPTGIMRGRFHPGDGQLYVAGLFGWAGDKTRPGGFYRVRYAGKPVHVPTGLRALRRGMWIGFSQPLDPESAGDPENYAVSRWTYQRTASYGSDDYRISQKGQRGRDPVSVTGVRLSSDRKSVLLLIPDMQLCPQMEIKYRVQAEDGTVLSQIIQHTIHQLNSDSEVE